MRIDHDYISTGTICDPGIKTIKIKQRPIKERADMQWKTSARHARLQRIASGFMAKHYLILIRPLSRRHAALLFQLRTGHVALNSHLHRIGCAESPICPACEEREETVEYVLLYYLAYARARMRILYRYGVKALILTSLLNRNHLIPSLFNFLHATK